MTSRLKWIDSAKGLAIFAVMMIHSTNFIFVSSETIVNSFIDSFYLTLFFLCSGFLSTKLLDSINARSKCFVFKDFSLLIPFFICGLSYIAIQELAKGTNPTKTVLLQLYTNYWSRGYWFLLVLFYFRTSFIIANYILSKLNLGKKHKVGCILISFFLSAVVSRYSGKFNFFLQYYPYFVLGVFVNKLYYKELLCNEMHAIVALFLAISSFIVYYTGIQTDEFFLYYVVRLFATVFILYALIMGGVIRYCRTLVNTH